MKRTILVIVAVVSCTFTFSQGLFDALKVTDNDITGTARYSSMAGAFGALGGDPSAIKDNPAGLGIYRKSEFSATLDALMQSSSSTWDNNSAKDSQYKVGANNFSFIIANPTWRSESGFTGLLSSNFSFSYNKLKNFNRNAWIVGSNQAASVTRYYDYFTQGIISDDLIYVGNSYEPYDNTNVPWMSVLAYEGNLINESAANSGIWGSLLNPAETVDPEYVLNESGQINEYSVGWSGNFSNKFFFGATLNLKSINFNSTATYSEAFGADRSMSIVNKVSTTGNGLNFNVGAIFVPVDFMRIGLSMHTPTFYSLSTTNSSTMNTSLINSTLKTPENYVDYQLQTPLQFNLSTAFILQQKGLISAEYVWKNYTGMKLLDVNGNPQLYADDNADFNNMLNNSRTIKIGGEYKLTPNFSLRAGYANMSAVTKTDATKWMVPNTARTDAEYFLHNRTDYLTAGFGYRENDWYIDFAFMSKMLDESFYSFNSTNLNSIFETTPAQLKSNNNNVIITLGLRF